jgi:hypothetical protein
MNKIQQKYGFVFLMMLLAGLFFFSNQAFADVFGGGTGDTGTGGVDLNNQASCVLGGGAWINERCVIDDGAFPVNCGSSSAVKVTADMLKTRDMVVIQPQLDIPANFPAGPVEFFALVSMDGKLYIAASDAFCTGNFVFLEYKSGDRIRSYAEVDTFGDATSKIFNVFYTAKQFCNWNLPVKELAAMNTHFYVGYAPKGQLDQGNYSNLHYSDIWFDPNLQ